MGVYAIVDRPPATDECRPSGRSRTGAVIGAVLLVTSLAVLLAVGIHSTGLGPAPAWLYDCDDFDQCEDLWAPARARYGFVAAAALAGAALGWVLVGRGLDPVPVAPAAATSGQREPDPVVLGVALLSGGALAVALLALRTLDAAGVGLAIAAAFAVVVMTRLATRGRRAGTGWLAAVPAVDVLTQVFFVIALGESLTLAGAVLALGTAAVALLGWLGARRALGDRRAWSGGGTAALAGLPVLGLLLLLVLALLIAVPVVWEPLPALLAYALPLLLPAAHLALLRRPLPAGDAPTSDAPADRPAAPVRWSVALPGAAAIVLVGLGAAWPVAAPPKDAQSSQRPDTPTAETTPAPIPTRTMQSAPTSTASPTPTSVPSAVAACTPQHLVLRVDGFDAAMGNSAARILATNTGDSPCGLRGRSTPVIHQGGGTIDLRLVPAGPTLSELTADEAAAEDPDLGCVVAPGESASAALFWPGYRNAADQTTPQSVTVILAPGEPPIHAPVQRTDPQGWTIGPAPFDLKDDVPGGAELRVGVWTPRTTSGAAEG